MICLYRVQKQAKPMNARLVCTLGRSGAIMMGRGAMECFWAAGWVLFPDLSIDDTGILSVRKFIKSILMVCVLFCMCLKCQ